MLTKAKMQENHDKFVALAESALEYLRAGNVKTAEAMLARAMELEKDGYYVE